MLKRSVSKGLLIKLAFAMGMGLVIVGGVLWLQAIMKPKPSVVTPLPERIVTADATEPDESPVTEADFAAYTVPRDQPRSISLPELGIRGLVQKVGITPEGNIAVPTHVFFAGWYTGSSLPGSDGVSIVDGHVSGRRGGGIFKRLAELVPDDSVHVEFGDKTVKRFRVVAVHKMPRSEAASVLFARRENISAQLNLITCGGQYDSENKTFTERVIVVTRLENDSR